MAHIKITDKPSAGVLYSDIPVGSLFSHALNPENIRLKLKQGFIVFGENRHYSEHGVNTNADYVIFNGSIELSN